MPTEAIRGLAVPQWARLVAVALCYFAAAKASLVFAIPPGYATAIWPPSGIALAALLLWGLRVWPGVWLGAVLTNYSIDLSMPAALGIAAGNTLEGVCAAWLATHLTDRLAEFRQPEHVFKFAAISLGTSAIAATSGVASLYLAGAMESPQLLGNWYTWWQGDSAGILLVTPCILAWARGSDESEPHAGRREHALFSALLIAMLLAVFAHASDGYDTRPLAFLAVPFFVWAACRFSERAVTLTVLAANGWAIWCTANGLGPFQRASLNEALLMLQAFTSTGALVSLVLWALLRRRDEALHEMQAAEVSLARSSWSRSRDLRERVEEYKEAEALARVGSWIRDSQSGRLLWSDGMHRILGSQPSRFDGSFEAYFGCVDPADRERVRRDVNASLRNSGSWDSTERIVRPDGERRVVRNIGRGTPAKGGTPARLRGVLIDVTERVAALPQALAAPDGTVPELGLAEALRVYAAQFELRTGVAVELAVKGAVALRADAAAALAHIAREALDNIRKHAGAHRVEVELACEPGLATLTVRDDGAGFPPDWQARGGSGVKRMREYAAGAGGRFWIESTPGNGATLRVSARG